MTTLDRVRRAFEQRLYLIAEPRQVRGISGGGGGSATVFAVQGSQLQAYDVTVFGGDDGNDDGRDSDSSSDEDSFVFDNNHGQRPMPPSCTCADHCTRGSVCKHIVFVLLRVLALDGADPRVRCLGISAARIDEIVSRNGRDRNNINNVGGSPPSKRHCASASAATAAFARVAQKPLGDDAVCVICFEDICTGGGGEKLVWCQRSCGQSLHLECFGRWARRSNTCPCCRCAWLL